MKTALFLLLLTSALNSQATSIICKIKKPIMGDNPKYNTFIIYSLENKELTGASLPDQSIMDNGFESSKGYTSARFSNECDNEYGVVFKTADLNNIKKKSVDHIVGKISYASSMGDDAKSEIYCRDYDENEYASQLVSQHLKYKKFKSVEKAVQNKTNAEVTIHNNFNCTSQQNSLVSGFSTICTTEGSDDGNVYFITLKVLTTVNYDTETGAPFSITDSEFSVIDIHTTNED